MIRKLSSVYVFAHSGFVIRCCPMAESLFILEIEFLHIRGGCSLVVVFFVLILVGTCSFILSASLCVVPLRTELHIGTKIRKLHNFFEW